MKKTIPIISYLIYIALAAWYAISSRIEIDKLQNSPPAGSFEEGLANGLSSFGHAIIMVLTLGCGAIALIALIVKLVHNSSGWLLFGLLSVVFDIAFTALHCYGLYSVLTGEAELQNIILIALLAVVSVTSLMANCSSSK